jgi:hypothetical protein
MEYKLLGVKFNVINVILCIALGFFICAMLGYNNKKIIEGAGDGPWKDKRKDNVEAMRDFVYIPYYRRN